MKGWELHHLWGAEGNLPKGELPGPTFVIKTELIILKMKKTADIRPSG